MSEKFPAQQNDGLYDQVAPGSEEPVTDKGFGQDNFGAETYPGDAESTSSNVEASEASSTEDQPASSESASSKVETLSTEEKFIVAIEELRSVTAELKQELEEARKAKADLIATNEEIKKERDAYRRDIEELKDKIDGFINGTTDTSSTAEATSSPVVAETTDEPREGNEASAAPLEQVRKDPEIIDNEEQKLYEHPATIAAAETVEAEEEQPAAEEQPKKLESAETVAPGSGSELHNEPAEAIALPETESSNEIEKPRISLREARHMMSIVSLVKNKEGLDLNDPEELKQLFSDPQRLNQLRKELRGGGVGMKALKMLGTITAFGLNKRFTNESVSEATKDARAKQEKRDQKVADFTDRGLRIRLEQSRKAVEYYDAIAEREREEFGELAYDAAYAYYGVDSDGKLALRDLKAPAGEGKTASVSKEMVAESLKKQANPWDYPESSLTKKQLDINEHSKGIAELDAKRGTQLLSIGMANYEEKVHGLHVEREHLVKELGEELREANPGITNEELQAQADAYWVAQNVLDHHKTNEAMKDTPAGKASAWFRGNGDRNKAMRRQLAVGVGLLAVPVLTGGTVLAVAGGSASIGAVLGLGGAFGLKTTKEYVAHKDYSLDTVDIDRAFNASKQDIDGEEGFNDLSTQIYNAKEQTIEDQVKANGIDVVNAAGVAATRTLFGAATGFLVHDMIDAVSLDAHGAHDVPTDSDHSADHGDAHGAHDASAETHDGTIETPETHKPGDPIHYNPEKDPWGNTVTGEVNPHKLADLNFNQPLDATSPETIGHSFESQMFGNPEELSTYLAEGHMFKDAAGNVIENPTAEQVNELGNAMKSNPELFGERYDEFAAQMKSNFSADSNLEIKTINQPFSSAYMDKGTDIQYAHGVNAGGHYVTIQLENGHSFNLRLECGQPIHFDEQIPITNVPIIPAPTETIVPPIPPEVPPETPPEQPPEVPTPKSSDPADYMKPGDDDMTDSGEGTKPVVGPVTTPPEERPPIVEQPVIPSVEGGPTPSAPTDIVAPGASQPVAPVEQQSVVDVTTPGPSVSQPVTGPVSPPPAAQPVQTGDVGPPA